MLSNQSLPSTTTVTVSCHLLGTLQLSDALQVLDRVASIVVNTFEDHFSEH